MKKYFTFSLLCIATISFGQRLLTEDFNYPLGQLTSGNGTPGGVSGAAWLWSSGPANFIPVVAGNLTYPSYVTAPSTSSNKVSLIASTTSAEDAYQDFAAQTAGTVYASFLLDVKDLTNLAANAGTGEYFAGYQSSSFTTVYGGGRIYIKMGVAQNTFNLGISIASPAQTPLMYSPMDYAINTTHLVTLAYTFVAGANNDIAKLFVDAPYSATEPAAVATSTFAAGTTPELDVARFYLRQGSTVLNVGPTTPNADIDALKISTSYADATLSTALPLNLSSFKGFLTDKGVQLMWVSLNELNVKSFIVEKSSDSRSFAVIGSIEAVNVNQNTYEFTDINPFKGADFYRLRMTDKDGTIKYSAVLFINNRMVTKAQIFPNPATGNITVLHAKATEGAFMKIVNAGGQQFLSYRVQQGAVQTSLFIDELEAGGYFLIYENNGDKIVSPLFKQ